MKRLLLCLFLMAFTGTGFAVTHYWTSAVNQDFATLGNWNTNNAGTGTVMTTFTGNALYINRTGTQKAIISSDIANLTGSGSLRLGYGVTGASGELLVTGGVNAFGNSLQVGGNTTGACLLTMSGGTLKFNASYATIGEGAATNGTININGGSLEADRMTIANNATAVAKLDISAGSIKLVNYMSQSTSGSLRFGSGNATMNISGTAVVEMDTLTLGNGLGTGLFTMSGGQLFTDNVTFAAGVLTAFEGGTWTLTGDKTTTINDAILNGYINHSGGNGKISVVYNQPQDVTLVTIVPEPATLMLLGLGGLIIRKRRS